VGISCIVFAVLRIFIDEVGNHDLRSCERPTERYLALTGVIMEAGYEAGEFRTALNRLKQDIFGTNDIVLHRRDILDAAPPFQALSDAGVRSRFNDALLALVREGRYKVCTVVIDKREHRDRYAVWRFHPYHYCLTVLLERYVQRLERIGETGDVVVEARGKKENIKLEKAYQYIYKNGTDYALAKVFQDRLTSRDIKLKPKDANIAGLQLADILANPSCRHMICERTKMPMTAQFSAKLVEVLTDSKYHRSEAGAIAGWGEKWLP
jgi:hypothetical protein